MQDLRQGDPAGDLSPPPPDRAAGLVERYARKALTSGAAGLEGRQPAGRSGPWAFPGHAGLPRWRSWWSCSTRPPGRSGPRIGATMRQSRRAVALAEPEAPWSPATRPQPSDHRVRPAHAGAAAAAGRAGEVVLLVPPGHRGYVARIAPPRRPLRLPGLLDARHAAAAAPAGGDRASARDRATPDRALLTWPRCSSATTRRPWPRRSSICGPVAGRRRRRRRRCPTSRRRRRSTSGVGKKDGATANDLVAVLTKDVRVERAKIGRIELRDAFSLVEIPAQDAERVRERAQRDDHPAEAGDRPGGPGADRPAATPDGQRRARRRPPEKR